MENASVGADANGHGRFGGMIDGPEPGTRVIKILGGRNGLRGGRRLGGRGRGGIGGGSGLGGLGGLGGIGLLLLEHWPLIHLSLLAQSSLVKHLYSRQPPSMQFGLDLGQFLER